MARYHSKSPGLFCLDLSISHASRPFECEPLFGDWHAEAKVVPIPEKKAALLALLFLAACVPCRPQAATRAVSGIVTDKRGNTLPGSVVHLENTVNLMVMSYITGKDGRYHFNGLSYDVDYTLRAKYRKYWSPQKTLSKFNSSPHPEVELVIPID